MDRLALILTIVGAIIWGAVGLFGLHPFAWTADGSWGVLLRIIFTIVALGGLWCIKLLFREREISTSRHHE